VQHALIIDRVRLRLIARAPVDVAADLNFAVALNFPMGRGVAGTVEDVPAAIGSVQTPGKLPFPSES